MTYRRRVRSTADLVRWGFARLNPGLPATSYHVAPVPYETAEALVLELLEVGRRRGRAELAAEIGARLGLVDELGASPPHEMHVAPSLSSGVPTYAEPEVAKRIGTKARFMKR